MGVMGAASIGGRDWFILKLNSDGSTVTWTKQFGGLYSEDYARAVAVDVSDNVVVAGQTDGAMNGAGQGLNDIAVVKLNSLGVEQWTYQTGTTGHDVAFAVVTDASENIYLTGFTGGSLHGESLQGNWDVCVIKLSSTGNLQWTKLKGTSGNDRGDGIAIDASGNAIVVVGSTEGTLGASFTGTKDVFAWKLSTSTGTQQWLTQLGSTAEDDANGVQIHAASGDVFLVGKTRGGMDGFTNDGPSGSEDFFIVKLDSSGVKQWTFQGGTTTYDYGWGVLVDPLGYSFVLGSTQGAVDGASAGGSDIFLLKLGPSGAEEWVYQTGTSGNDDPVARSLVFDADWNIVLAGSTTSNWPTFTNAGSQDVYVMTVVVPSTTSSSTSSTSRSFSRTTTTTSSSSSTTSSLTSKTTTSSSTSSTSRSFSRTTTTTSSSSSTTSSLTSKTVTTTSVTSSTSMSTATSSGTTASTTSSVSSTSSSTSSKSSTTASMSSTLKTLTTSSTSGTVFTGTSETLTTSSTSGTVFTGTSETLTTSSTSGTAFTGTSETLTTSSTSGTVFTGTSEILTTSSTSGTVFTGTSETLTTSSTSWTVSTGTSETLTTSSTSGTVFTGTSETLTTRSSTSSTQTVSSTSTSEDSTWTSLDAKSTWTTSVTSGFATIGDVLEELEDNAADLLSRANEIGPGSAISSASSIGTGTLVKLQSCAS